MFEIEGTFEIPRLERPSRREFEERFLLPQRPVVVCGAMEDWPARKQWTNDYLTEKVGARTIQPSTANNEGRHLHASPKKSIVVTTSSMKLADYIELVAGGDLSDGQLYVVQLPIKTGLPELWPDIRFPPFVDEQKYSAVNLWFGPGNNVTPLHYDLPNNLLTQVRGRKQVVLCPPREIARVYPFPFGYLGNHISQVNVADPDLTRFPAWADADRALVELGPGDMLFIPACWWHAVCGIDQNISINYWWRCRSINYLKLPRQMARLVAQAGLTVGSALAQKVIRSAGRQSSSGQAGEQAQSRA
ncbi:cupin-like domain-containing protein [Mycobacterium montefiorense]|nr:cupin-like domain-containing protein [Mycobacterium montefiorense]